MRVARRRHAGSAGPGGEAANANPIRCGSPCVEAGPRAALAPLIASTQPKKTAMPIEINESANYVSYPIVKHKAVGEYCRLAVIRWEQRAQLKKDSITQQMVKIPNGVDRNNNPKYKQELVIHAIVVNGNMQAAIGDASGIPASGDRVRVILKAKAFGDWIEQRKLHRGGKFQVGDLLDLQTTHAQQYDQNGVPKGAEIRDHTIAAAVPRGVTLGFYGTLTLSPGADSQATAAAEAAYRADEEAQRQRSAVQLPAMDPACNDEFGGIQSPAEVPGW